MIPKLGKGMEALYLLLLAARLPFVQPQNVLGNGEIMTEICNRWNSPAFATEHHHCFGRFYSESGGLCFSDFSAYQCLCDLTPQSYVRGSIAKDYCEFLIQNTRDSWMYPYRGRHPQYPNVQGGWSLTQELNYRCSATHYCLAFIKDPIVPSERGTNGKKWEDQIFRFSTHRISGGDPQELTNRLRFTDQSIAQEGISFCIAGRHFKRSLLTSMESLKGFLPLMERSFDIGNHIHPENSNEMNRFDLTEDHKNLFSTLLPQHNGQLPFPRTTPDPNSRSDSWNMLHKIPRNEYEDVLMGFINYEYKNPIINRNLPLVEEFRNRPAHPDFQPGPNCHNPYKVQVSTIEADGKSLHNYLHIKVYSENVGSPTNERCPTGRIKLLMLEVRDEYGYPVGQFTDEIPCDKDEATLSSQLQCPNGPCRRWTGTKANQVPCMFTHPQSTVHPSILMVSAPDMLGNGGGGPGNNAGGGGGGPGGGQAVPVPGGAATADTGFCRDSTKRSTARPAVKYEVNEEYFTEVHATWRYAQMNNKWVKELHFATLIIEDEKPIQYYTGRKTSWQGPETVSYIPCAQFNIRPDYRACNHPFEHLQCCWSEWPNVHPLLKNCGECINGYWDPKRPEEEEHPLRLRKYEDRHACYHWTTYATRYSRFGLYQFGLINRCVDEKDNTNRPYGYSAQYSVLQPTSKTLGGWDNFQSRFIPPENVNCHVDLTSGDLYDFSSESSKLPVRSSLKDYLKHEYRLEPTSRYKSTRPFKPPAWSVYFRAVDYKVSYQAGYCGAGQHVGLQAIQSIYELPDWHTPGASLSKDGTSPYDQLLSFSYFGIDPSHAALKMFRSAHQDPAVLKAEFPDHPVREYFGSEHLMCLPVNPTVACQREDANRLQNAQGDSEQSMALEEMAVRSRCPCPFIPTTPPPELQTKTDLEIDGRQVHFINTLFAWMVLVLVPLAFFVARFYKETFSKVFFLQEFWWYTIHVLTLLTALLFTIGGIYGMKLKRDESYVMVWTNATYVHVYTSYVLIGLFVVHLCIGPFRLYKPEWRMIQIALHWGIGWLEYCLAIVVSLSATAIPTGMMNCSVFGVYCGFIVFQIGMTVGMELHMRLVVDKELALDPPRDYMPPPMMRLFHRDAPFSKCRIVMLIVFIVGCVTFYGLMHLFMALDGGEVGCFQPSAAKRAIGNNTR